MKKILIVSLTLLFCFSISYGESFQEELQRLAGENAKGYLTPFSTAFGSNLNSGLFHSAKPHKVLGFDLGVKIMFASVPDEDMMFDFAMPTTPIDVDYMGQTFSISPADVYPENVEAPTVFGEGDAGGVLPDTARIREALTLQDPLIGANIPPDQLQLLADEMPELYLPPGFDIPGLPMVIPQVSVGLPMKTEVLLRFMPATKISDDMGEFGFFGIGVKHSISQYIPMFPVAVSVQYAYQSLKFGDIITSNHTSFGIMASKGLLLITPYAGLTFESSTLSVDYTYTNPDPVAALTDPLHNTNIKFDLDGDNSFHARFGFKLSLLILGLNAEYAIGTYNVATVGLFLQLR